MREEEDKNQNSKWMSEGEAEMGESGGDGRCGGAIAVVHLGCQVKATGALFLSPQHRLPLSKSLLPSALWFRLALVTSKRNIDGDAC